MTVEHGLVADRFYNVTDKDTADVYGSGLLPVLSTPHLIGWMEDTSQKLVMPYMRPGESTVGIAIEMKHKAATPIGMRVRVRSEVVDFDGRRIRFKVRAWDEVDEIAECIHERYIINDARFMDRVQNKASAQKK
ncbi:MAG: thioesterase family protein [Anaerolineae bacterium]|nr:thioesterase family protein [Anaerolineae bacterium]